MAKERSMNFNGGGDGSKSELHVTAGSILTPVMGFRGAGITGTPPRPEHRGFPGMPGDGPIPGGKSKTTGANSALKAFGLNGKSEK